MPLIVLNCLRTSFTTSKAAFPTASIKNAENRNGTPAPKNNPINTKGSIILNEVAEAPVIVSTSLANTEKSASDASTAEPIANPFVTAFVVLPTASNASVILLVLFGIFDISAMPPALSVIGPYASIETIIPVSDSIATAAIAIPYTPLLMYAKNIPIIKITSGANVDFSPTARPAMTLVPGPVSDALAIVWTGLNLFEVK